MDKLELLKRALPNYLNYELKVRYLDKFGQAEWDSTLDIDLLSKNPELDRIKPYLRPLSDLTKEIEHNGEKFIPLLAMSAIATVSSPSDWIINKDGDSQHK